MEQQFDAVLTGSDSEVIGLVTILDNEIYEFNSIDGSLQLTITKNTDGNWTRIAGTDPYFSGWIEELAEQIQTAVNS